MLDKDTFLRNSDTRVKDNIRKMIQPFPEAVEMQENYQIVTDWKNYKFSSSEVKRTSSTKSTSLMRI